MWFAIILGVISVLYYYIIRDRDYFERNGVKFVKPLPLLGTSWKAIFGIESYFDYYNKIYTQFSNERFFGAFDLLKPVYVIRDVELCRKVFITNFDHFVNRRLTVNVDTDPVAGRFIGALQNEDWKRLRNITSPSFTGNKMKFIHSLVNDTMARITNNLSKDIESNKDKRFRFDAYDFYSRCTTDLIANTTFGLDVNSIEEENNEFYLMGKRLTDFTKPFFLRATLFIAAPRIAKLFKVSMFDKEATDYFTNIIKDTIEYRKKNDVKLPNFIQLFMEADLTFEEILPLCVAFFFGGIDSFATLFKFMSYELATNPEVQERLQQEIDEITQTLDGSPIDYDSVPKLKYMDAVIQETFRKNPAGAWLERVCNKPFIIREKSEREKEVKLSTGDVVIIPLDAIQHNPQHFPDPEKFDPDRFLNKDSKQANTDAVMPFGLGPRMCIATRFNMMQTKVFFFNLLSKFTLKTNEKTVKELKIMKGTLLRKVEGGLCLDLVKRG